jgi:hypothetical protein
MQLNPKAAGLTLGLVFGLGWLVLMIISLQTGFLDQTIQGIGGLHPRFSYSYGGAVWMMFMYLIGGFVEGYILAWAYNKLNK